MAKKKFLWFGSVTLGATAIVAPISVATSCSNRSNIVIDEVDQENGVSSSTYDTMKEQLKVLYRNKLEREWTPTEKITEAMKEMDNSLHDFDEIEAQMIEKPTDNVYNYTDVTSALTKWAYDNYQIQLTRNSTKGWDDILQDYLGMRESSIQYMRSEFWDGKDIQEILDRADKRVDELMDSLHKKYPEDPLSAYIFGRNDLMACFEETNADIAFMSAMGKIKDFIERYDFVFKEMPNDESNRYDKILPQLRTDKPISPELMNQIFICTDKETGKEVPFDTYTSLPGYKIVPLFHKAIPNPITNFYQFEIDWTIVSMNFVQTPQHTPTSPWTEEDVTAHLYKDNKNVQAGSSIDKSLVQQKKEGAWTTQYVDYTVLPSKSYEMKQLKSYYLDPTKKHINLKWVQTQERSELNKYEAFFEGIQPDASTGTIKFTSLANSGLMIGDSLTEKYENVSDVLDRLEGDEREYTQVSYVEQFVKYVDTTSKVTIVDPGQAHKVSHIFQYEYKSSVSKKHECVVAETSVRQTNGFKISRKFFETANTAFNKAYSYFEIYFQNKFEDAYEYCRSLHITFILNCASTAWEVVKTWLKMANWIWQCNYPMATREALTAAVIITNGAFIIMTANLYHEFCLDPAKRYYENTKKFNKETSFITLRNRLQSDLQYFVLEDEDGNCDKDEMDAKYEKFAVLDFQKVACPMFQFYTTINVQPVAIEFQNKVNEYGIDPVTFVNYYTSWTYWGTCKAITWGYSGIRALLAYIIFYDWERSDWMWYEKALEIGIEFALESLITLLIQTIIEAIIF